MEEARKKRTFFPEDRRSSPEDIVDSHSLFHLCLFFYCHCEERSLRRSNLTVYWRLLRAGFRYGQEKHLPYSTSSPRNDKRYKQKNPSSTSGTKSSPSTSAGPVSAVPPRITLTGLNLLTSLVRYNGLSRRWLLTNFTSAVPFDFVTSRRHSVEGNRRVRSHCAPAGRCAGLPPHSPSSLTG